MWIAFRKQKLDRAFNFDVQGQSTQTVFSKLALRDRNMQVRFFWKVVLKF